MLEAFKDIDFRLVLIEAAVTEEHTQRLLGSHSLHHVLADVLCKASHESVAIYSVNLTAVNFFRRHRQRELYAPRKHSPKEEVEVGAVGFDIVNKEVEHLLVVFVRLHRNDLIVAAVDAEDTETRI